MKRIVYALVAVLFVVLPFGTSKAQAATTISVTGDAQVNVVPDEVIITLGIETSDKVLKTAKSENDQRVGQVIATIKDLGVPAEKIQTDYINIEPRYGDSYRQQDFVGYFVRKNLVVTLTDLTKFEDLLTGVLDAGANYLEGVQFRTTELRKYRDQARTLAIQAAKEKADALAGDIVYKVGKALSINEDSLSCGYYCGRSRAPRAS